MKKIVKERTVKFPWGKVSMVTWGDPANPPILLVHGYMDSAATFIPLVEELPDTYYYVAFDMPGHGKSDAFPPGMIVSQLNIVEVVRGVVERMKWDSFVYLCHSMGFIIGIFYNHLYPGKIIKMVHLDPGPPLAMYYYPHYKPTYWYHFLYENYYSNFASTDRSVLLNGTLMYLCNFDDTDKFTKLIDIFRGSIRWIAGSSKQMTYDAAINLVIRNRSLTEEQAEAVLSRSLIPVGDGQFRLSWDSRMKKIGSVPLSEETLYTVITEHTPPTLFVEAAENRSIEPGKQFASNILDKCRLMLPNCSSVTVPGGHDVHLTNPESIAPHIVDFLKGVGIYAKSKL